MSTGGPHFEANEPVYASPEEVQAAHDAFTQSVGDLAMSPAEIISVAGGMPPGGCSILSPMELQIAVQADEFAMISTPMRVLQVDLESHCGPQTAPEYSKTFDNIAKPQPDATLEVAAVEFDVNLAGPG